MLPLLDGNWNTSLETRTSQERLSNVRSVFAQRLHSAASTTVDIWTCSHKTFLSISQDPVSTGQQSLRCEMAAVEVQKSAYLLILWTFYPSYIQG